MSKGIIKVSVPGSIMLLGEYAVLHGGNALVCAVEQRIYVQLTPRADDQIELISSLGTHKTKLTQLEITSPFQFVLAIFKKYQKQLQYGCTLTIQSEFSAQLGLASSAAVTVATLAAVVKWLQISHTSSQLIRLARSIVQEVQGLGSGADVAACVLGGIIAYRQQPLIAEKINVVCPLNFIYSGSKTPTVTAVNQVETFFANYPKLYKQLLRAIDECTQHGVIALKNKNLLALGQIMNVQQGLMSALGVNTPILQGIVEELRAELAILGAKISGSGLGDGVVAVGTLDDRYTTRFVAQGARQIPITIATQGARYE